jgi:hypothetical protein
MARRACRASALLALASVACHAPQERAAAGEEPPPRVAKPEPLRAALQPEIAPFEAPAPWRSRREGAAEVAPPPLETWRALASQDRPLQTKTPRWQALPPEQTVELAMPEGSAFRCLVTPLQITPAANDFNTELRAFVLARTLLCSADGFRSWTEHPYDLRIRPDGTREEPPEGGALLRERGDGETVRHSFVLLRSDPEPRAATTGPPQVLPGVAVDDD